MLPGCPGGYLVGYPGEPPAGVPRGDPVGYGGELAWQGVTCLARKENPRGMPGGLLGEF